jgi:hypothetical protein
VIVYRRDPKVFGCGHFGQLFFFLLPGHFDDQAHEVAVSTLETHDKIRDIIFFVAVDGIGNGETQVVVLDVT